MRTWKDKLLVTAALYLGIALGLAAPAFAVPFSLTQTLTESVPAEGNQFGYTVAIDGGNILVAAPYNDTGASNAGAAYLFDTAGNRLQTFSNPTPASNDYFGIASAISGDYVLIGASDDTGASDAGAAYLFRASTGALLQTFLNPNPTIFDGFGSAVAISGDKVLIGASNKDVGLFGSTTNGGAAYLYQLDAAGTGYSSMTTLVSPSPVAYGNFGYTVGIDGNNVAVTARGDGPSGAVYLFDTTGTLQQTFTNPEPVSGGFGTSIAISGDSIVVGAPYYSPGGVNNVGTAYLFDATTGDSITLANPNFTPSDPAQAFQDYYGRSVAIDGNDILVGAMFHPNVTRAGAAYLFDASDGTLQENLAAGVAHELFGIGVGISDGTIVVGADGHDAGGLPDAGAAYLYEQIPTGGVRGATWDTDEAATGSWDDPADQHWLYDAPPVSRVFPSNDVPNGDFFNVFIDGGNGANASVALNTDVTIDSLTIDDGDQLSIADGRTLGIIRDGGRAASGAIHNSGTLNIDAAGGDSTLETRGVVTLDGDGTGVVTLADTSHLGGAWITGVDLSTDKLVNVNNTIQGEGSLGRGLMGLENQAAGLIDANVAGQVLSIQTDGQGLTNAGTLRASNGGILRIGNSAVSNNGGTIEAQTSSRVDLSAASVDGGRLTSSGTGFIQVEGGGAASLGGPSSVVLDGADVRVPDGATLRLSGNIDLTDNAAISLNATGSSSSLEIDGEVTLGGDGTGVVTLVEDTTGGRAQVIGDSDSVNRLINVNNTIQGEGQLGAGSMGLENQAAGLVDANLAGRVLSIQTDGQGVTNAGTLWASNGGILSIASSTVANDGGTIEAQTGSRVDLSSATVRGGTLTSSGTGFIQVEGGSVATLVGTAGVTLDGADLRIQNDSVLYVIGNIDLTNNAAISLNATTGYTNLQLLGDVTLGGDGTGVVTLSDSAHGGKAQVFNEEFSSGSLINVNNTIRGEGQLGGGWIGLENQAAGLIDANVAGQILSIHTNSDGLTNAGTVRASDGGILRIFGSPVSNDGGTIEAQTGSRVDLSAASVDGGTLTSSGTGFIQVADGDAATLGGPLGITLDDADLRVQNNSTLDVIGNIDLTNNAAISLNASAGTSNLELLGDVTLGGDGTGVVTLSDSLHLGGAQILVDADSVGGLVNVNNTIQGEGRLGDGTMGLENQAAGLIDANVATQVLTIQADSHGLTNAGTLRASNGGILEILGSEVDTAGGTVEALDNSVVDIGSTAVVTNIDAGGSLNGGTWRAVDGGHGATVQIAISASGAGINAIGADAAVELSGANSAFTIDGVAIDGTLAANSGRFSLEDGRVFDTSGDLTNDGAGALVHIGTDAVLNVAGVYTQNSGTTELAGGTLNSLGGPAQLNGGSLTGSGVVLGGMAFGPDTIIDVGASPGILNLDGDTVFDGLILLEIAGLQIDSGTSLAGIVNTATDSATTDIDQINVFGVATLLDSLEIDVSLTGGFAPATGDFFDLMTADSLLVDLAAVNLLLPTDFVATVVTLPDPYRGHDAQALRLTFVGLPATGVPEPGTLVILVVGLVGLIYLRRRKAG